MLHVFQQVWNFLAGSWQDPNGYNFISGPLADLSLLGGLGYLIRKHNCHVHRCWRLGHHPVDGTPYVTCRKHHPGVPNKVSHQDIKDAYKK